MKLKPRRSFIDEFICDLTNELDLLSGITKRKGYGLFQHYILFDNSCKKDKCLPIRVPGGTVGGVWIDDSNTIIKIHIDTKYVIKTYPENINELIKKFIGEIIELED